jgi:hypothetical protein
MEKITAMELREEGTSTELESCDVRGVRLKQAAVHIRALLLSESLALSRIIVNLSEKCSYAKGNQVSESLESNHLID